MVVETMCRGSRLRYKKRRLRINGRTQNHLWRENRNRNVAAEARKANKVVLKAISSINMALMLPWKSPVF